MPSILRRSEANLDFLTQWHCWDVRQGSTATESQFLECSQALISQLWAGINQDVYDQKDSVLNHQEVYACRCRRIQVCFFTFNTWWMLSLPNSASCSQIRLSMDSDLIHHLSMMCDSIPEWSLTLRRIPIPYHNLGQISKRRNVVGAYHELSRSPLPHQSCFVLVQRPLGLVLVH